MLRFLRSIFAIILITSLGLWFLIHSSYVQNPLKQFAYDTIYDATGQHVTIESLSFSLPCTLHINQITVNSSPDLTIDTLTLVFSPVDIYNNDYFPESIHITRSPFSLSTDITVQNDQSIALENLSMAFNDLNATGALRLYPSTMSIEGRLTADTQEANSKAEIHFHKSDNRKILFTLDVENLIHESVQIDHLLTSGFLDPLAQTPTLNIARLEGSLPNLPFALIQPAAIRFSNGVLSLDDATLSIGDATVQASLSYDQSGLDGRITLQEIDLNTIPLGLALEGTLNGSATIENSFITAVFDAPFRLDEISLAGELHGELYLNDVLNSANLTGTCQLSNGTFGIQTLGTDLHALTGNFTINNALITLTDLSAKDHKDGLVTGTGQIVLNPSLNCPFELDLAIYDTIVVDQAALKASFDGKILFAGDLTGAKISGKGSCTQGSYTIPEQISAPVHHVDVTYVNKPEGAESPQAEARQLTAPLWPLAFNLVLDFPKNFLINAKDLTSSWKGAIELKGSTMEPLFFGDLNIVDGKYAFNGKPMVLEEGTITFSGDIAKKLSVYVIANRDLDNVSIDVILKGPVKNPSISFRSNPPMPQREILSWLLFNTGSNEISPFQGSQLSESITNLNTIKQPQSPDILTKIRNTFGIDRLEFGRCGKGSDSQMSVQVGKYISDNVLICINKREVNSVAIEAAITDKFKLQAQVSDDAQGQMLLKWKRDY